MVTDQKGGFCPYCQKHVVRWRKGTHHLLHLALTVLTGGLWLFIWIGVAIKFGGWRCSQCGRKT